MLPFGGRQNASAENLAMMVPKRLRNNARLHRELSEGQEQLAVNGLEADELGTIAIPLDGEQLERLFAMIAKGLIWYYWREYLSKDYEIRVHVVTKAGEQFFEDILFKRNSRHRVQENLGKGVCVYEGLQGTDDLGITVWRFSVYGGLISCEDTAAPETVGSKIVVITGPKAAFKSPATAAETGADEEKSVAPENMTENEE